MYQIKKEMLFDCIVSIDHVKKSVSNFFETEKFVLHYENFQLYLRVGLKIRNRKNRVLEFDLSKWQKLYIEFSKQKKQKEKKW